MFCESLLYRNLTYKLANKALVTRLALIAVATIKDVPFLLLVPL